MGTRHHGNGLLGRISSGLHENATRHHRVDLEWLGRRAAAYQFQEILAGLKDRIAQRAAVSPGSPLAVGSL